MGEEKKSRLNDPNTKVIKQLPTTFKSDRGYEFPVDIIKDMYMKDNRTVKSFARRLGINKNILSDWVALGGWDESRRQYRERLFNILKSERVELIEMKQSLIQRIEMFKMLDIERQLQDLEEHFEKYGDFFLRDESEEILRDRFQNPISRKIGMSRDDIGFLKETEITRETNNNLLKEAKEQEEQEALEAGSDTIEGYLTDGN